VPAFHTRTLLIPVLAALAALALAACGGDDSTSTTSSVASGSASSGSSSGGAGTVDLADNSALGTEILVDSEGRTLYLFEKDDSADESYCSGACAKAWPPLTVDGDAAAGSGLDSSQLTTFDREDGAIQVAFAGHPLYLYTGDKAPGDASGNGVDAFGAEWYAIDSSGATVEEGESSEEGAAAEETTSTTDTDSSGGYGY
jgi:predicted lipoprotein with Yx(FWY)xxD motif